jgi:hypothetical protein
MTDRVCVMHIGTHKTGSTLLQHFLQWNAAALERAGLFFPSAGWYGVIPGQHAAAWELCDEGVGTETAALFHQLCENGSAHAIISSEEFSLLFDRGEALSELVGLIRRAGYQPKVFAYVRAQPALVESMFAERVKHRDIRPFGRFLDSVLETGGLDAHGRRVTFCNTKLLAPFAELIGDENIRLHSYPVPGDELAIIHDFLAALAQMLPGFSPENLRLDLHRTRMNDSLSFGHLLGTAFVALFPDLGLPEDPDAFIREHVSTLPRSLFDARFSLLEREDYLRFLDVFGEDNRAVRARYGNTAQFLTEDDIPSAHDPRWAVAAIERPLLDACLTKWIASSQKTAVGNEA